MVQEEEKGIEEGLNQPNNHNPKKKKNPKQKSILALKQPFNKDAMPGDAISAGWFLFCVNNVAEQSVSSNRMTNKNSSCFCLGIPACLLSVIVVTFFWQICL